ncbi:MAG: hypothetical protein LBS36_05795 [Oscillospiraceae bacterium]|jgi:hypothetical protein|nr:hypothetical protein [Oscillospiraceae bacterium]
MGLLQFAMVGNYSRFWNDLKNLRGQAHKPASWMFFDTCLCTLRYGSGMQDYLNYRFYEKKHKQRREYLTIGYQARMDRYVANTKYSSFLSLKPNFHRNYSEFTRRDWFSTELGYERYLAFLERNPVFIYKPKLGLGGTDIEKISVDEIADKKAFYDRLVREEAFIEELIRQNDAWGKLCPASINTLRVMTTAVNGKSEIIFAAARIGNGSNVADNFHQGGMAILVDMERGRLTGTAFNKKLERFTHHPLTGVKLDGYEIPFWKEIRQMCLKAALVNEGINLVGWDVAITNDGPLLIEGNRGPGWDLVQVLLGRGTKYMVQPLIEEMKASGLWDTK